MGDIADDIIDGNIDYVTGEWIGDGGGFPRTSYREKRDPADYSNSAKEKGMTKWFKTNNIPKKKWDELMHEFIDQHQPKVNVKKYETMRQKMIHISAFCFREFTTWVKKKT